MKEHQQESPPGEELSSQIRTVRARDVLKVVLQLGVSVVLLIILFHFVDISKQISVLRRMTVLEFLILLSFHFAGLFVSLIRWQYLLLPFGIRLSWFALGWVYWMGAFFNTFFPTNIGGDVIRIYQTGKWSKKYAEVTASVVVERWTGLLAFLFFSLLAVALGAYHLVGWETTLVIGVLTIACAGILYMFIRFRHLESRFFPRFIRKKWVAFRESLQLYQHHGGAFWKAMAWAFVVQGIVVLYFYVVAVVLRYPVSFIGSFVVVPLTQLASLIPVGMWGFGTREAVFAGLAHVMNLSRDEALMVSLTGASVGILFNMLGGVTLLIPYHPRQYPRN